MDLETAYQGFWLDKTVNLSEHTVKRYGVVFDRFCEFLGNVEVEEITTRNIKEYLLFLNQETKLSKRSIYDNFFVLSSFWSWASKELKIEHPIKGKVDTPKYPKKKIEPIPIPDVQKMIKICESNTWANKTKKSPSERIRGLRDKAIIMVLIDCGLRVGELSDLIYSDYLSKRGRLFIRHGKGDKERFVFVGLRTRKAIWRYLATRKDTTDTCPLFATSKGQPTSRFAVRRLLKSAAGRAGIEGIYPHRFRHTFAIEFLRSGGNPFTLKEILGHETLEQVMDYVALAEADLEAAVKHNSPADNYKL